MSRPLSEYLKELKPKRRPKYGNVKCQYKGMTFDSKLELQRYQFLEAMQGEGRIGYLRRQVPFPLLVNGVSVGTWVADFQYMVTSKAYPTAAGGPQHPLEVEDVKGYATPEFKLKSRLFLAVYGVPIHIVTKKNLTSLPDG